MRFRNLLFVVLTIATFTGCGDVTGPETDQNLTVVEMRISTYELRMWSGGDARSVLVEMVVTGTDDSGKIRLPEVLVDNRDVVSRVRVVENSTNNGTHFGEEAMFVRVIYEITSNQSGSAKVTFAAHGDYRTSFVRVDKAPFEIDLRVNGLEGVVTLARNQPFIVGWSAPGARTCQLLAPRYSGLSLEGSAEIGTNHEWYPRSGELVYFLIECNNGDAWLSKRVAVRLAL